MTDIKSAFDRMLLRFSECFTKPTFENFKAITEGWILTTGRKTMTKIIQSGNHMKDKHFTVYPRFFSRAVWSHQQFIRTLGQLALKGLLPFGKTIYTAGDDTLYPKSGKKISGCGLFRDAILSTHKTVTRWGLNFVTTGLIIKNKENSPYQCLPLLSQLHKKGKNTPS